MIYGQLPGIARPVSRLIQGTVMVGSDHQDESFALLDGVFELGGNAFDTAHVYGGGDNERTVGRWVRERGVRDQVVIVGKGAHPYDGRNRVTPQDIFQDIGESLERFGFDHIDLYLLHRDDESVPVGEIVDALNEHRRSGRIHAYGGSNWTHQRIASANDYAAKNGKTPFAVSSPQFGLAYFSEEPWEGCVTIGGPGGEEAREFYSRASLDEPSFSSPQPPPHFSSVETRRGSFALLPWSSLGGGIFSGRFTRENLDTFTEYLPALCARCYGHEENFRRYERAAQLGRKLGRKPAQVALAWVLAQPMNVFPLVGCGRKEEFAENAAALDLELTPEQVERLEGGGLLGQRNHRESEGIEG